MKDKKEIPFSISQAKKEAGRYCCAYGCTNDPVYKKGGLCHNHYRKKTKALNPVFDRYRSFKDNAVRRGKGFSVTLEEFKQFCKETGYIIVKGRRGFAATIDRPNNLEGYHINNMDILSLRANARKYHAVDKHLQQEPEVPF